MVPFIGAPSDCWPFFLRPTRLNEESAENACAGKEVHSTGKHPEKIYAIEKKAFFLFNFGRMDQHVFFREQQKFRQWWIWLILAGINGFFIFGALWPAKGREPVSNAELWISAAVTLLVTALLLLSRLDTRVQADGIYVRFFPFHLSFRHYSWEKISRYFIRKYHPLKEYGGWGIRAGFPGKGKAYNVSGNRGLQLEFPDGKKLLIGTNKPEELEAALGRRADAP
jgi:hypothetical protein